jgi:hypothetical protein
MKMAIGSLLCAAIAGAGCVTLPAWQTPPPAPPSGVAKKPAKPRPMITPELVNDDNARQMADALLDELDHDTPINEMR